MAEIHGCGEKARNAARRDWMSTSSGNKPLTDSERDAAKQEIRNKVNLTICFCFIIFIFSLDFSCF